MKGCLDCKHKISEYNYSEELKKDIPIFSCAIGLNKEINKWWNENSKKTRDDIFTDMECFEDTEGSKLLKDISNKLDELSKLFEK